MGDRCVLRGADTRARSWSGPVPSEKVLVRTATHLLRSAGPKRLMLGQRRCGALAYAQSGAAFDSASCLCLSTASAAAPDRTCAEPWSALGRVGVPLLARQGAGALAKARAVITSHPPGRPLSAFESLVQDASQLGGEAAPELAP
jgi:hypothetical protein